MSTFGFDEDGDLVEVDGPAAFATNQILPMPLVPTSIIELHQQMEAATAGITGAMGLSRDIRVNPSMYRTLTGIARQQAQADSRYEKVFSSIVDHMLNTVKIVADPFMPETVRRQFRFPRSKKRRIQKKWRKDARNWRDERVMWLVDPRSLTRFCDTHGTSRIHIDRPRSNGIIRNFT